jgi:hypothetical protein
MKFIELEPQFVRHEIRIEKWKRVVGDPLTWKSGDPTEEVEGPCEYLPKVDTLGDAQGVMYLCPKCFAEKGGPVGCHRVLSWFRDRGITDDVSPGPGRWPVSGTCYDDLTLTGSVFLQAGCAWHGYITNGSVTSV